MAKAFLRVVAGARQGLNIPLPEDRPLVIGRRKGDLILEDPMVSGAHAQVLVRDGAWVLQDLGSTNGTLLDNRLVREAPLHPGAEIDIGNTKLVLFVGLLEGSVEPGEEGRADPHLELAWLRDEELVEIQGPADRTRSPADIIDQDLRLPPGFNAVVEVVSGKDAGKVFRFTRGNVLIGRRTGEVPLQDLEVSRHHSVIEVFGREMVFLRDLGSTNGTYHNGRRIGTTRLRTGDSIGVGRTVLRLQITL